MGLVFVVVRVVQVFGVLLVVLFSLRAPNTLWSFGASWVWVSPPLLLGGCVFRAWREGFPVAWARPFPPGSVSSGGSRPSDFVSCAV